MMAELSAGTLNSSAANFNTAVKGAASGTLSTLNGSLGSLVNVILKDTLAPEAAAAMTILFQRWTRSAVQNTFARKWHEPPGNLATCIVVTCVAEGSSSEEDMEMLEWEGGGVEEGGGGRGGKVMMRGGRKMRMLEEGEQLRPSPAHLTNNSAVQWNKTGLRFPL